MMVFLTDKLARHSAYLSVLVVLLTGCSNPRDNFQNALLEGNSAAAIDIIRSGKIDVNSKIPDDITSGYSLLHLAVSSNDPLVVEELIKNGANVNENSNIFNQSPIHLAVNAESIEILQLLIDGGCHVDPLDEHKQTPLMIAVIKDNTEVAEFLLRNGANPQYSQPSGRNLFHWSKSVEMRDLLRSGELSGNSVPRRP